MAEKLINIGDINKSRGKFKRHVNTNLTTVNLHNSISNFIEKQIYNEPTIIINANSINNYFESGKFYDDFYDQFKLALDSHTIRRVSEEKPTFTIYIEFDAIDLQGELDNFNKNIYEFYTFGIYKEGGFKSYLIDILTRENIDINFVQISFKEKKLHFEFEAYFSEGELFDKLYSYYRLLTN
jgi:hypothetical protein